MKIKKLHISNFKSIADLEIINPNPFSVFVGPNGAGKSNIFEALELFCYLLKSNSNDVINWFGGVKSIYPYYGNQMLAQTSFELGVESEKDASCKIQYGYKAGNVSPILVNIKIEFYPDNKSIIFPFNFSRLFLGNSKLVKVNFQDDSKIALDGSNLEKVLQRVFQNENNREEIIEWLQVLVPEFKDIKIESSTLSGEVDYVIYEKHSNKPFPKHLISDGTKNILALLTAVYQSDEPQFLCIEEPENGLHPHVIRELVGLFRRVCQEKGHFIWLNTHSETLVRQLTVDEIIVVDKKNGATKIRQFQGQDMYGLKMDDAWLTNALGGGLP